MAGGAAASGPQHTVLPRSALAPRVGVPFGVYIHVPFCASRCGYCAFNTYTSGQLGGDLREAYVQAARAEIRAAARFLAPHAPPVHTVFVGGGTPTELDPADLCSLIAAVRDQFDVIDDVEITIEANPDSVDRITLDALRAAGVTRMSFGMQSVRTHVLAVLERSHTPGAAAEAVRHAHAAGFEHVSLDLIYGTPGETDADWQASLGAALAAQPDHISAYALTIEPSTRLAARVRRGQVPEPDEDTLVRRYAMADELLSRAGYAWYELSNWARGTSAQCRHNLGYWRSHDWWGIGPGAHGHLSGTRWCNVAHPAAYAAALAEGQLAVDEYEVVAPDAQRVERVLLGVRLASGFAADFGVDVLNELLADDLVTVLAWAIPPVVQLSRRGRMLADMVARRVLDAGGATSHFFASVTVP